MIVYHTSNNLFDFPSFEISDAIKTERSAKAYLGFYVGESKKIVEEIGGEYIYELTLEVYESDVYRLPLHDMIVIYDIIGMLAASNDEAIAMWIKLRNQHVSNGRKLVRIVEQDGRVGESAITDLSCIKGFKRIK